MRILLTGVTGRQTKDSRISKQKIYDTKLIYEILCDLGHEITWRQTRIDEDWSKYDLAIVALGPAASFNSGNLLNSLWIINKLPTILHFEDWKISGLLKTYKGCAENPEPTLLKTLKDGHYFYANAGDYKDHLNELVSNFQRVLNLDKYNHTCIVPGFKWGDKAIVRGCLNSNNIISFDLTPKVITNAFRSKPLFESEKKKEYFLASLGNHDSWIKKKKLTWPVYATYRDGDVDTELGVFRKGEEYWGILAPEYDHSGSGWFRIRFIYSALGNSCMVCSDRDAEQLGAHFYFNREEFENMSNEQLKQRAEQQRETIKSYETTYDELKETFVKIINNAIANK